MRCGSSSVRSPCAGRLERHVRHDVLFVQGGVGRTMALVNVAVELAQRGRRVLAVDFDLEAPGLDTFKVFRSRKKRSGIVDFVAEYLEAGRAPAVEHFVHKSKGVGENGGCLWVMPSGEQHGRYATSFRGIVLARSVRAPRRVPSCSRISRPVGTGRQAGLRADRLSDGPHGHRRHLHAAASGCGRNPLLSERSESPGSDHGRAGHSGGSRERSQEGDRAPLRDVERTGSGRRGPVLERKIDAFREDLGRSGASRWCCTGTTACRS